MSNAVQRGVQIEVNQLSLILLGCFGITLLHYSTDTEYLALHEIYQRLYYIPIIYAAYRYGVRGGIGIALVCSLIYLPHIFLHWRHYEIYLLNQLAEVIMFQVVALVTGLLANAERQQRNQAEHAQQELQQAYCELQQTIEQLVVAERMASTAELSLALVHEIRNPLGAIRGATEALESMAQPQGTEAEFLTIIQAEVNRLNRLVTEFLEFGRPRAPDRIPSRPNEIVRSVVLLTGKQARQHNVTFNTRLADDLPLINVDSEQIKQVLINLFLNAMNAMPTGGLLTISTQAHNQSVEIGLADSGKGISEEVKQQIFKPFHTTRPNGRGLGLAICHRLVTQNGGTITVHKGQPIGTVFLLHFPVLASKETSL